MNVKRWFALTSLVLALGGMPGVAAARPRVRVGLGVRIGPPVRFYRPFPRYHSWGGITHTVGGTRGGMTDPVLWKSSESTTGPFSST